MSTLPARSSKSRPSRPPLLENGDRMTQAEFHRLYEACPEDVKAELIGGIVYMASPLRRPHANYHAKLSLVLGLYEGATPGVELLDNATMILGEERDSARLIETVQQGLASREHAPFVKRLEAAHRKLSSK